MNFDVVVVWPAPSRGLFRFSGGQGGGGRAFAAKEPEGRCGPEHVASRDGEDGGCKDDGEGRGSGHVGGRGGGRIHDEKRGVCGYGPQMFMVGAG